MGEEKTRVQQFSYAITGPCWCKTGIKPGDIALFNGRWTGESEKRLCYALLFFLPCKRQIMNLLNLTWRKKLFEDTRRKSTKNNYTLRLSIQTHLHHSNVWSSLYFSTNKNIVVSKVRSINIVLKNRVSVKHVKLKLWKMIKEIIEKRARKITLRI